MKLKTACGYAVLSIALLGVFAFILETFSVLPGYETQQAKILNVQADSKWGYIGEDMRTLVQWPDGCRSYIPGAMGEPGEIIPALRQVGTTSMLGWMGDRRR